ncbi:MAG: hypothetical protein NUV74_06915 [Candidatus Brocadiaceae bacterium]|nr:hypothetical protein [Candidatus Brocadiaceae bacterium]
MSSFLPNYFRGNTKIIYLMTIVVVAAATVGVVLSLENVSQLKE